MREAFDEQLDKVFADLAKMCQDVDAAVRLATNALLSGEVAKAEQVISGDVEIDRQREAIETECFTLLSLQAPVASDLRVVVAALRMVTELERMGDLSVHIAKVARLRTPMIALPADARPIIGRMAQVAEQMVTQAGKVIADRDVVAAEALAASDDEVDQLRRKSFSELLDSSWAHGIESAVDVALLGRYYERIADHAVSVANRVVYVVTGENPTAIGV